MTLPTVPPSTVPVPRPLSRARRRSARDKRGTSRCTKPSPPREALPSRPSLLRTLPAVLWLVRDSWLSRRLDTPWFAATS